MTIDILLAVFNSERFLAAQLDSILAQEDRDWRLLIRDGGSTDGSAAILEEYRRRDPGRIVLLPGGKATARENFAALLEASRAERINIDPRRLELRHLLLQNAACGCTMLFNRPLRELALPIPPEAFMHDHWLMLTAACLGRIEYLPESTLLYRQHGDNVFGASGYGVGYFCRKLSLGIGEVRGRLFRLCRQAGAFREQFRGRLSPEELALLADVARLPEAGFLERRRILWRRRIFKSGFLRNLGMFLVV